MTAVDTTLATGTWSVDETHSYIAFEVAHMGISIFNARFADYNARLVLAKGTSELTGSVRTGSVEIRNDTLRDHVLGGDFLDAEAHPTLTFRSTDFDVNDEDVSVHGELTIKGVTRAVTGRGSITPAVADRTGSTRLGLSLVTIIDRRDYGLDFQLAMPDGGDAVGNEVTLIASLELIRDSRSSAGTRRY